MPSASLTCRFWKKKNFIFLSVVFSVFPCTCYYFATIFGYRNFKFTNFSSKTRKETDKQQQLHPTHRNIFRLHVGFYPLMSLLVCCYRITTTFFQKQQKKKEKKKHFKMKNWQTIVPHHKSVDTVTSLGPSFICFMQIMIIMDHSSLQLNDCDYWLNLFSFFFFQ